MSNCDIPSSPSELSAAITTCRHVCVGDRYSAYLPVECNNLEHADRVFSWTTPPLRRTRRMIRKPLKVLFFSVSNFCEQLLVSANFRSEPSALLRSHFAAGRNLETSPTENSQTCIRISNVFSNGFFVHPQTHACSGNSCER